MPHIGYSINKKKAFEYELEGTHKRGRPKKTWKQQVVDEAEHQKFIFDTVKKFILIVAT